MQRIYLLLFLIAGISNASAQLSVPGAPLSELFSIGNPEAPILAILNEPVQPQMRATTQPMQEDGENLFSAEVPIVAQSIAIHRSVTECGNWTKLPNGNLMWRALFTSPGAGAIGVLFSKYKLPQSAELYIYNEDKSQLFGAFTHLNNNPYNVLNTAPVDGETVVVELNLYRPQSFDVELEIGEIVHYYSSAKARLAQAKAAGPINDGCFVSVNCSPEGDAWQTEKRGIAQMYFVMDETVVPNRWGFCSGSMANNTRQDGTPYFLTAFHCGGATSETSKAKSLFYFDYEKHGCATGDTARQTAKTLSGCERIAYSSYDKGLDMLLLKIHENPPAEWNVYFNGWDFTRIASVSGVGIHHPAPGGDVGRSFKRISTYTSTLVPVKNTCVDFGSGSSKCGLTYGFWGVLWSATDNGHSVTASGSSGSPLFNSKKRIVGTLTGGSSECTTNGLGGMDMYSRFDRQWDEYPAAENCLKPWLDPLGISAGTLDGYGPNISTEEAQINGQDALLSWRKADGEALLTWKGTDGVVAEAFSTNGKLVGSTIFYSGENRWTLPEGAVYLIRVAGEIVKIQL